VASMDVSPEQAMLNDVEAIQRMFADLKSAGLREEEEEEAAGPAKASSSPGKHELIHDSLVRDLSIVGLEVQGFLRGLLFTVWEVTVDVCIRLRSHLEASSFPTNIMNYNDVSAFRTHDCVVLLLCVMAATYGVLIGLRFIANVLMTLAHILTCRRCRSSAGTGCKKERCSSARPAAARTQTPRFGDDSATMFPAACERSDELDCPTRPLPSLRGDLPVQPIVRPAPSLRGDRPVEPVDFEQGNWADDAVLSIGSGALAESSTPLKTCFGTPLKPTLEETLAEAAEEGPPAAAATAGRVVASAVGSRDMGFAATPLRLQQFASSCSPEPCWVEPPSATPPALGHLPSPCRNLPLRDPKPWSTPGGERTAARSQLNFKTAEEAFEDRIAGHQPTALAALEHLR